MADCGAWWCGGAKWYVSYLGIFRGVPGSGSIHRLATDGITRDGVESVAKLQGGI